MFKDCVIILLTYVVASFLGLVHSSYKAWERGWLCRSIVTCIKRSCKMQNTCSIPITQECTHGISLGIWYSVNLILMPILIFEMGLGMRLRTVYV